MTSLVNVGDKVSLTVARKGAAVAVAISGTYNQTILLQSERGSPGSGSWQTVKSYTTANATVADSYTTAHDYESIRLITTVATSGTAVSTLTEGNRTLNVTKDGPDGSSIVEYKQGGVAIHGAIERPGSVVDQAGATLTLTAEVHAGKVIDLDRAAGVTVTLPAATGTGNEFTFFTLTTVTSNNNIIKVANSTDVIQGPAIMALTTGGAANGFVTASADDTITMNGTTKGGIKGDKIVIKDVAAGFFSVHAALVQSGTAATPFSSTV